MLHSFWLVQNALQMQATLWFAWAADADMVKKT